MDEITTFGKKFSEHFETVNNGELTYFMVIWFHHENGLIYADQTNYLKDIAEWLGMSECKTDQDSSNDWRSITRIGWR